MVFINWVTLGSDHFLFFQRFNPLELVRQEMVRAAKQRKRQQREEERLNRIEQTGTMLNPSGADLDPMPPLAFFEALQSGDVGELDLETMEPEKWRLYYGVKDFGGVEVIMSEELWEDDDHEAHAGNVRGGGKGFWLRWCQNGGRNGDSMPFSVWMHPADFQRLKAADNPFEILGPLMAMPANADNTEQMLMHLYPWSQHEEVVMNRVREQIAEEEDYWDEDEREQRIMDILGEQWGRYASTNAQTRGEVEGLIRPEVPR